RPHDEPFFVPEFRFWFSTWLMDRCLRRLPQNWKKRKSSGLFKFENLFFFRLRHSIDFADLGISQLLDGFMRLAVFVFADHLVFQQLLELLIGVTPHVAHSDSPLLCDVAQ